MSTAPLPGAWHCQRCGYDWYGRRGWSYADGTPNKCPACKDPGWNHARKYRARVLGGRRRAGKPAAPLHLPPTIPPTPLPPPEPTLEQDSHAAESPQRAPGATIGSQPAPEPSQLALAPPAGAEGAKRYLLTSPQSTGYLWALDGVIVASDLRRLVGMRLAALPASWLEQA